MNKEKLKILFDISDIYEEDESKYHPQLLSQSIGSFVYNNHKVTKYDRKLNTILTVAKSVRISEIKRRQSF